MKKLFALVPYVVLLTACGIPERRPEPPTFMSEVKALESENEKLRDEIEKLRSKPATCEPVNDEKIRTVTQASKPWQVDEDGDWDNVQMIDSHKNVVCAKYDNGKTQCINWLDVSEY